jgi:hypothetical protein
MSHAYSYPAICRQGGYTDSIFLHGTMSPLLKAFLEAASAQIQPRHLNQTSARIALRAITMRSNNGRRLERNRKFVDSPLEGNGFEPSVPRRARTADSAILV